LLRIGKKGDFSPYRKREFAVPLKDDERLSLEQRTFQAFLDYTRLTSGTHLKEFLESLEKNILCRLLARFNGNQTKTASYLGMKYTTFNWKVKKHGIRFRKTPFKPSSRPPIS
jgi:DNA-binding NtrC family response regulator